ncbi:uncharacterized protein PAC_06398 [Phialocephala subalpina]|uniref:Heterokaryon incompatibility domain-containing protein n=1 Tax=Phialocephala subalpina TaxID=576137 RepID=A0A1L7WUR3_9HELO|nr:uncharacterized protein PAC_06398 [Phialocephala subalpina]
MRLIDTATLQLHEYFGDEIPRYAILSHRWEEGEVKLQDFESGRGPFFAGWKKITGCCAKAASDGWPYVWIDCCCIDKMSSVELSEAINSMFNYYRGSEVCYAYLSDVQNSGDWQVGFENSKWFTRGWTLQELLAPRWVEFLDREWNEIGTKQTLQAIIERATGITHLDTFETACIAQKMSWASRRETTRPEDQAYCLMGIFGVSMPLLYGEGSIGAFERLQLQILSKSDDESIFAWADESSEGGLGLLATSPSMFAKSGSVQRANFDEIRPPYGMTNKGLRFELLLTPNPYQRNFVKTEILAPLNCSQPGESEFLEHLIALRLISESGKVYRLGGVETLEFNKQIGPTFHLSERTTVHIDQKLAKPAILDNELLQITFKTRELPECSFNLQESFNWFENSETSYEWVDTSDLLNSLPGIGESTVTFATGPPKDHELSIRFFSKTSQPSFLVGLLFRNTRLEQGNSGDHINDFAVFVGSNPNEVYLDVVATGSKSLGVVARENQLGRDIWLGGYQGLYTEPPRPSRRKDRFLIQLSTTTKLEATMKKVRLDKGLTTYVTELHFEETARLTRTPHNSNIRDDKQITMRAFSVMRLSK